MPSCRLPSARVAWWWCGLTVAATLAYLVVDDATRSILLLLVAVSGIVGVSVGATRIGPRQRWPWYLISVAGSFFLVGAVLRAALTAEQRRAHLAGPRQLHPPRLRLPGHRPGRPAAQPAGEPGPGDAH